MGAVSSPPVGLHQPGRDPPAACLSGGQEGTTLCWQLRVLRSNPFHIGVQLW
ncbi:rCG24157 [Rattus norvegicus]|uniref:RCG24157 n=1 Tax=Rattus norvegicus TaxID=10116 RepID=A6KAW2_RAT|nr:rCG24157 [Rattus norvegicus]